MNLEDLQTLPLDKNVFYFVSPWGLGDTMIFCGLKNALEKSLGGKIHFIIKPSHSLIMKMFGITEYITATVQHSYPHHSPVLVALAAQNPYPVKGSIYVAHPEFHPRFAAMVYEMQANLPHVRFLSWYKQFFGLPEGTELHLPSWYPPVSDDLKARFEKLGTDFRFDNTALFLPEATSVLGPDRIFWECLIREQKRKGMNVITNIVNQEKTPLFKGIPNIDLSLEELVSFSLACKDVYALRSGICDLIFSKGNHLHIYYPTDAIHKIFNLKDMFQSDTVDEKLLSDSFVIKCGIFQRDMRFMQIANHVFDHSKFKIASLVLLSKRGYIGI